jgi:hypothetical protein
LLPVLLIAAAVIVVGPKFIDGMPNLLGDLGRSTDIDTEYAVAPGARPQTDKCTAEQILKDTNWQLTGSEFHSIGTTRRGRNRERHNDPQDPHWGARQHV